MREPYLVVGFLGLLALVVFSASLVATVSLIRTEQLTRFQKIAQTVIVWVVPIVGAWLVVYLVSQSDRRVVPRWIPNDTINDYVYQLLGFEGKIALRAAEQELEHAVLDSLSGHETHVGGHDPGGGGH